MQLVWCRAMPRKKYQLLQTIRCGNKIVYNGPRLFFPQTAAVRLPSRKHWGSSCVRNCFGNIYGPDFMKKIYRVEKNSTDKFGRVVGEVYGSSIKIVPVVGVASRGSYGASKASAYPLVGRETVWHACRM